jgi:hypothetical protein
MSSLAGGSQPAFGASTDGGVAPVPAAVEVVLDRLGWQRGRSSAVEWTYCPGVDQRRCGRRRLRSLPVADLLDTATCDAQADLLNADVHRRLIASSGACR